MSTSNEYRSNAEDCLRMASKASEERDRPLWATMAQSWLRLAEHADRMDLKFAPEDSPPDESQQDAQHAN